MYEKNGFKTGQVLTAEALDHMEEGIRVVSMAQDDIIADKVYLRKNIVNGVNVLTQDMIAKANTIYIIQYDFDLRSAEITIPKGCVLVFQGGSLSNGRITGGTMQENRQYVFRNVEAILANDSVITPQNFGAKLDEETDDTNALNAFFKCGYDSQCDMRAQGTALLSDTVIIPRACSLPLLNFVAKGIDKPIVYIDNYRFGKPLEEQTGEDMIRDVTIEIGAIANNTEQPSADSVGIKISSCRAIRVICPRISACGAGLLLEGYDSTVGWISYSRFDIKYIVNCKSGIKMRQYDKSGEGRCGWVTECSFYEPQISAPNDNLWDEVNFIDMQTEEGNTLDGHIFIHPCLEGANDTAKTKRWAITLKHAILNTFLCPRYEAIKEGGVRWLGSYSNNPYPNLFFGGYGDYERTTYDGIYGENRDRYIISSSPMYSGNIRNFAPVSIPPSDLYQLENGEYASLPTGLSPMYVTVNELPQGLVSARGAGISVIGSTKDWEREANFILWANASSSNKLFFRKSKSKDDGSGSNYGDWYIIQKRNEGAIEKSFSYRNPNDVGASDKYEILQQFIGYAGLNTYMGDNVWVNKRGYDGELGGAPGAAPFGTGKYLTAGDCYMAKYDTAKYKPFFYIGEGSVQADNWVTADGEKWNLPHKGTTAQRPQPKFNGFFYFDTTLNKPIWYIDSTIGWVDANGASV